MVFGFYTDPHVRFDTPIGRSDNYYETLLRKHEELGDIWRQEGVDVVLCGGDIFNTPNPSLRVIYDVMHALRSWDKPIYSIVGSHDYFGYQPKTLKRTAIGLLEKAGVLQIFGIEDRPLELRFGGGGQEIRVYGTSHSWGLSQNPQNLSIPGVDIPPNAFVLQVVHGDLVDKSVPWTHITIDQVPVTRSNIVLSGHYHPGWRTEVERTYVVGDSDRMYHRTSFVNPGSLGRGERCNERPVQCYILETSPNGSWAGKFVSLNCAVLNPFNVPVAEVVEPQPMDLSRFLELLENMRVDTVDVKEWVVAVAKEMGFGQDRIDRTFELLEEAKDA